MLPLSIIIPVFRESGTIEHTINHLSQIQLHKILEIIVVDGDCNESTITQINGHKIVKLSSPKGRGIQMNLGASIASGEVLLFLHADTSLPENAVPLIQQAIAKKNAVAGAFYLGIDSKKMAFRIIEIFARFRTRFGRLPYGDQAIFITKQAFNHIGGYPEIPIMEDVVLVQKILKFRLKFTIIPQSVKTSARRWEAEGILYCTLRNWALFLLFFFGVSPKKLSVYYR